MLILLVLCVVAYAAFDAVAARALQQRVDLAFLRLAAIVRRARAGTGRAHGGGHVAPAAAAPEQAGYDDDEADQNCQELFSLVMRSEIAQQHIDNKLDDGEEVGEAELRAADAESEQVQAALCSLRSKLGGKIRVTLCWPRPRRTSSPRASRYVIVLSMSDLPHV